MIINIGPYPFEHTINHAHTTGRTSWVHFQSCAQKRKNQENPYFGKIELKKSSKTHDLDFGGIFLVFLNYFNNHKPDEDKK